MKTILKMTSCILALGVISTSPALASGGGGGGGFNTQSGPTYNPVKDYQEGVSCPHCFDTTNEIQRQRFAERQKQMELAASRNEVHLGAKMPERKREDHGADDDYDALFGSRTENLKPSGLS